MRQVKGVAVSSSGTWMTPVECPVHKVPMNARPTVAPSKSIPLKQYIESE